MPLTQAEYSRRYRARHPERARASTRRWRERNPANAKAKEQRQNWKRAGIDPEVARAVLSAAQHCAICGVTPTTLDVDHDHETGVVRGALCNPCNRALGLFKDSPSLLEAAAAYLRRNGK